MLDMLIFLHVIATLLYYFQTEQQIKKYFILIRIFLQYLLLKYLDQSFSDNFKFDCEVGATSGLYLLLHLRMVSTDCLVKMLQNFVLIKLIAVQLLQQVTMLIVAREAIYHDSPRYPCSQLQQAGVKKVNILIGNIEGNHQTHYLPWI